MPGNIYKFSFDLAEIFIKIRKFPRIIGGKSGLSADYTMERQIFPQVNPWQVKTFCGLFCGQV
jgi:hypothetical protein